MHKYLIFMDLDGHNALWWFYSTETTSNPLCFDVFIFQSVQHYVPSLVRVGTNSAALVIFQQANNLTQNLDQPSFHIALSIKIHFFFYHLFLFPCSFLLADNRIPPSGITVLGQILCFKNAF